jgi:hypothetical protein
VWTLSSFPLIAAATYDSLDHFGHVSAENKAERCHQRDDFVTLGHAVSAYRDARYLAISRHYLIGEAGKKMKSRFVLSQTLLNSITATRVRANTMLDALAALLLY